MTQKAKRIKTIHVTKHDIAAGEPEAGNSCPIARAVARSFKKKVGTYFVNEKCISHVSNPNYGGQAVGSTLGALPQQAQSFVKKFDSLKPVRPFSFVLRY